MCKSGSVPWMSGVASHSKVGIFSSAGTSWINALTELAESLSRSIGEGGSLLAPRS